MKKISFILLLSIIPLLCFSETIRLKSGKIIKGKIVTETSQYIKVDSGLGTPITYYFDDIETIDGKLVDE